jgi:hypothetical protein
VIVGLRTRPQATRVAELTGGTHLPGMPNALQTPTTPRSVAQPAVRGGVDLGVRTLATVATVDLNTGEESFTEYPNPACSRRR